MKTKSLVLVVAGATLAVMFPGCEDLSSFGLGASYSSSDYAYGGNDIYDSAGVPIFGYTGGRPVYGYTNVGRPIYDVTYIQSNSYYVPSWGPSPKYRGSYRAPAHAHRVSAPPSRFKVPKYDNHRPSIHNRPSYHGRGHDSSAYNNASRQGHSSPVFHKDHRAGHGAHSFNQSNGHNPLTPRVDRGQSGRGFNPAGVISNTGPVVPNGADRVNQGNMGRGRDADRGHRDGWRNRDSTTPPRGGMERPSGRDVFDARPSRGGFSGGERERANRGNSKVFDRQSGPSSVTVPPAPRPSPTPMPAEPSDDTKEGQQ